MNEPSLQIVPFVVNKPAVKATVDSVIVQFKRPEEWGTVRVIFFDENDTLVQAYNVAITYEESQAWTGDDTYVLNLALQKLGIKLPTKK